MLAQIGSGGSGLLLLLPGNQAGASVQVGYQLIGLSLPVPSLHPVLVGVVQSYAALVELFGDLGA